MMISRSTTPDLLKMVNKLEEFFQQQLNSGIRALSVMNQGTSVVPSKPKRASPSGRLGEQRSTQHVFYSYFDDNSLNSNHLVKLLYYVFISAPSIIPQAAVPRASRSYPWLQCPVPLDHTPGCSAPCLSIIPLFAVPRASLLQRRG